MSFVKIYKNSSGKLVSEQVNSKTKRTKLVLNYPQVVDFENEFKIKAEKTKAKFYQRASMVLSSSIESWYNDPDNREYEPHYHIKIYKKLKREEYFDMKRSMAYERLIRDCNILNIDPKVVKSESDDISVKKKRVRRTSYKQADKFHPTNNKSEPMFTEFGEKTIYDVLEIEEVYLDDEVDVSISVDVVKDERVVHELTKDDDQKKEYWIPFDNMWRKDSDFKMPSESVIKDSEDIKILSSLDKWAKKEAKLNVHEYNNVPDLKEPESLMSKMSHYNGRVELPNILQNGHHSYQLAFMVRDNQVVDVKYINDSEYDSRYMRLASDIHIREINGSLYYKDRKLILDSFEQIDYSDLNRKRKKGKTEADYCRIGYSYKKK